MNTILVVIGLAQAGHVVGLAAKLGSLGVHVGDAHLLTGHPGQHTRSDNNWEQQEKNEGKNIQRTPRWTCRRR